MEPLVSLRVHRVIPRNPESLTFLTPNERTAFFTLEDDFETAQLPPEYASSWQFLPRSCQQIYLGETFSFVICMTNESTTEIIRDLVLKVDLQLYSQRVINLCESKKDPLEPKQCFFQLLHHEVKEMGANVLTCTMSYRTSPLAPSPTSSVTTIPVSETQSFRKFFKFYVEKPLDVKTKFYNAETDEVYLEALLENLTNLPMRMDSVKLEPSQYFDVTPMNTVADEDGGERWVFGKINRFNPNEFRQYLFCLTPKQDVLSNVKLLKSVTVIGKLDIVWTSGVGCNGHLQTSQLERMGPTYSDLRLTIVKIPSTVTYKKPFKFTCRITNCCDFEMEPLLYFDNSAKGQSLLWLGISGKSVGKLAPSQSVDVEMTAYPIKVGLCPLARIKISEPTLRNNYDFDEVAYVYVNPDENGK